jgi:predicted RNase H-like HicB family nuclease
VKTYRIECEWDETGWWVVTIPEVSGAVTQCKRLDKVPDDVGEVLELLTGKKPGTYELDVHTIVPGKAGELAARALELRAQADALAGTVAATTCTAVVTLSKSGFSMRDIGQLVGVSHQRVDQILKADDAAPSRRSGKRTSLKVS